MSKKNLWKFCFKEVNQVWFSGFGIRGSRRGVCSHLWDPPAPSLESHFSASLGRLHPQPQQMKPGSFLPPSRSLLPQLPCLSWVQWSCQPCLCALHRTLCCTCSSIHPHVLSQCKCSLPDGWLYSLIKLSCSNSSWKIQFRGSIVKNSVSLSTLLSPHFFCHLTPIMGC